MAVNILLKGKQKNLGGKRQTMGKLKSWISNLRKKEQRLTVRSYLPKGGRAWMCVKVINRVLKVKKNLKRNAKRNDWGPEQDAKFLVEVCWAKARNHTPPWGGTRKKRGSQMEDPIKCGVPGLKRCAQAHEISLYPIPKVPQVASLPMTVDLTLTPWLRWIIYDSLWIMGLRR